MVWSNGGEGVIAEAVDRYLGCCRGCCLGGFFWLRRREQRAQTGGRACIVLV